MGLRHSNWTPCVPQERFRSTEAAWPPVGEEMHDGILNKVSAECVDVGLSVQLNCGASRFVCACLLNVTESVISHRIRINI
jgi:hypothetical protein